MYVLKVCRSDMGDYKTNCKSSPMETAWENGLWHVNRAREHDGLRPLTLQELKKCATLTRKES